MSAQLRLNLERRPDHARAVFVVSDSNAQAVRTLDAWPDWRGGALALVGPPGSGKTHLPRLHLGRAAGRGALVRRDGGGPGAVRAPADRGRRAQPARRDAVPPAQPRCQSGRRPASHLTSAAGSMGGAPARPALPAERPAGGSAGRAGRTVCWTPCCASSSGSGTFARRRSFWPTSFGVSNGRRRAPARSSGVWTRRPMPSTRAFRAALRSRCSVKSRRERTPRRETLYQVMKGSRRVAMMRA